MSNISWKKFHICFSNFRCPSPSLPSNPTPKQDQNNPQVPIPSNSSKTSIMINNFNSLYDQTSNSTSKSHTTDDFFSSSDDNSDAEIPPPDFATVFASQRFFFSSPGSSNSIFESPDSPPELVTGGGLAIQKYSPDPHSDFRRSMQEMVDARQELTVDGGDHNWEYLHELLLCYLTLNPKHTHKFIISAFSDLVISRSSSSSSTASCHRSEPQCAVRRRL